MPQVSVIVPIFNGVAFLPAFFESLDAALPHGSQVILVDDGSTEPIWDTVPPLGRHRRWCASRTRTTRATRSR